MANRISRGLQDIRTISGRIDDRFVPHKAYMKLSVLEMEKFRRGMEKQSALNKVSEIDQRFKDIEAEKRGILASLEGHGGHPRRPDEPEQQAPPPRATSGSFKIRY